MVPLASLSPELVQEVTNFLVEAAKNPASLVLAIIIIFCVLAYFLFGKPDNAQGKALIFIGIIVLTIFLVVFFKPFTSPVPNTSQNQELNANYTRFEDLLASRKFMEADRETTEIIRRVTDTQDFEVVALTRVEEFPCADLDKIDKTWTRASNGWFGFSPQLRIWRESGMDWGKFIKRVGWDENNDTYANISDYSNFSFNTQAPEGQLPVRYSMVNVFTKMNEAYIIRIFDRLDACRK